MARGINKVILVGNCGQDPETRYMPNGNAVTNISIATSEHWKDKQTGEPHERTGWHRVVFYNRLGEIAGEYLRKGSQVYVEGSLRTRKWQDQSGQDRYTTEIIANEMQMLGRAQSADQNMGYNAPPMGQASNPSANPAPQMQQAPAQQQSHAQPQGGAQPSQPAGGAPAPSFDNFDDDIPF